MYWISDYSELYCSWDTIWEIKKSLCCLIKNGAVNKMYVGVEVKLYAIMALAQAGGLGYYPWGKWLWWDKKVKLSLAFHKGIVGEWKYISTHS